MRSKITPFLKIKTYAKKVHHSRKDVKPVSQYNDIINKIAEEIEKQKNSGELRGI